MYFVRLKKIAKFYSSIKKKKKTEAMSRIQVRDLEGKIEISIINIVWPAHVLILSL